MGLRYRPLRALLGLSLALTFSGLSAAVGWPAAPPGLAFAQGAIPAAEEPDRVRTPALEVASNVQFSLGVGGQPVADAWNPLRLQLRDAPPATLTIQVDQGTLRSGEVPLTISLDVRGGAGVSIFEELVYLPTFATLSWRLATAQRVLASGSIAGREADGRPLDLLLTSNPGAYRLAYLDSYGSNARLVDIAAAHLPQEVAAYDGVRSLIIDGTAAAPRLEAVAAAVAGGVVVTLVGPLPSSHAELDLLLDGAPVARLGAGALLLVNDSRERAVELASQVTVPSRSALQAVLLQEPLIERPTTLGETTLVVILALYALGALLLLRFGGSPGLVAAAALAGLVSLVAWQLLRPAAPQVEGGAMLALAGGELAILYPVREVLTMPRAELTFTEHARPMRAQAHRVDPEGTHLTLERWRSVLLERAPILGKSQLSVRNGVPHNHGPTPLKDLYLVGEGLQGDLAVGSSLPRTSETGSDEWAADLAPLLPDGTWLARDDCAAGCTTWVVYPPAELVASAARTPPTATPPTDPFRSAPGSSEGEP